MDKGKLTYILNNKVLIVILSNHNQAFVSKVILGVTAGMILGVPITNYIASGISIEKAMLFFAIVNAMAFIARLVFVPSIPVKERLSYGAQISVLKKPIVWLAIAIVVFIGSSTSSINSFIAEYLGTVTNISGETLTSALFFNRVMGDIICYRK